MPRKIIHIDLDAFFCAVEEQRDPSLIGKPFAVGGRPEQRGVVSSCSYAARRFGVHSAMPTGVALRICPDLLIVHSHYGEYQEKSRLVMQTLHDLTPMVEQVSIDEAFLDVSDLPESGEEIARKLQNTIKEKLGLSCSLGIATNKLLAKVANNVGKASAKGNKPPNAITNVPAGKETEFLAPLPVKSLWGVGPKTTERLSKLGIKTIGQLANFPPTELTRLFGKTGKWLSEHARGIDEQPIATSHEIKSISQETTFSKDIQDEQHLRLTLRNLSESVGKRLRLNNLVGSTIKLKLRLKNFTTLTRQMTLTNPTDQDSQIYAAALLLFERTWSKGKAIRLIGIGLSKLSSPTRQLGFWEDSSEHLQSVLDHLRDRYGDQAIKRGSELQAENKR
jgi:DNA polymerase-4